MKEDEIKKEKKKLNKYFIFFLISTVGSMVLGDDSQLGMIFSALSLISLIVLIAKGVDYKRKVNEIKK
ncbi:hypothetical protein A2V61_02505 [Candidatus Woesebacteria bacterium RBG_19FT_COMBO_47_8]|uniref:Uncharacterized protein n=1 Tax=Candidatus Woesebacteria bacterium RBG_13_46_13 TaxID=1802479 RepID=A0A1F7X5G8_9BACT|nr:MAG: hypothetical protein A2Y68_00785 [Candidatus Woesebacteria bacterium RBG_13_46_13]OGM17185.1 MAG: hypothetical protein A2V61_02505 [Candidatus Woesebacteria bacterium RBG_19FT_COMBO_47_8]